MDAFQDSLMEDLITNASVLFDDRSPSVNSPPLPPAPAGQPAPNYTYGSAHTKVASVPAPQQMPVRQQAHPESPEDFTPRLPARPANSIHPSLRTNPASPTKASADATPALPTRPAQPSPSKPAAPEKLAPTVPKLSVPYPPENEPHPSSPPTPSFTIATQEEDERVPIAEGLRDNTSVQEAALPSPVRSPKPLIPTSVPSSPTLATSESAPVAESSSSPFPTPPVPGAFPS